ncbi:dTDP-4-dehydrorhamnose reductase [Aequoribacter fuscus]|uniref:dTDP-4-dehydrorhamnose reductase n=1 Tax=Aequoribacter fuscus TaxID=2518989 RepID=UPI0011125C5A|nr:dTDP-4-dehydrorhamnose reductase [Aequoribacter fuscus]QHJ88866.1 dTDP-4-dehydrorhamnose reductase [Aequoribacter fuscus]
MKILVTGSNGQVGHDFKCLAENSRHDWICFDRKGLDISDEQQVADVIARERPHVVINCAAYTAVDKAESEPDRAFAINAYGAANLAKACQAHGAALIHISTDYVFAGDTLAPYEESDPTGPTGIYGESKLAGEQAIAEYLERHIILRTAWVFGAHGNNFVKTMLRLGAERDELGVVADQWGAPTSAAGIAACCLAIAEIIDAKDCAEIPWGIYHFTGLPSTSWHGFAEKIFKDAVAIGLLDKAPKVNAISSDQFPTPAKRPSNSQLDCSKIFNCFQITPDNWEDRLLDVLKLSL